MRVYAWVHGSILAGATAWPVHLTASLPSSSTRDLPLSPRLSHTTVCHPVFASTRCRWGHFSFDWARVMTAGGPLVVRWRDSTLEPPCDPPVWRLPTQTSLAALGRRPARSG